MLLIVEIYAPAKELRDAALTRAKEVSKKRGLHIISVGKTDDEKEWFFSFIEPENNRPASEILAGGEFPNMADLRIVAKISPSTVLNISDE